MKRLISIIILAQLTFLNADNYSLSFDGVDDYVDLGRPANLNFTPQTNAFSISTWCKTTSYGTIYSFGASASNSDTQIKLVIRSDNYFLETNIGGTATYGTTAVNDGNWHHIAATIPAASSGLKIYIDGSLESFGDGSGGIGNATSSENGNIGARTNGTGYLLEGSIDELAIWNDTLTAAEVTALYNSGSPLTASSNSGDYTSSASLVGYWNFNEGSGSTLTDQTSNDNDGTINGATWSTDVPGSVTYYVATDGSDDNDGSENSPFATIQAGIDASSSGDTVLVATGTYTENINYNGKNIVVQGEDRETTIIDGNQSGSVVTFNSSETLSAVLTGFTIQNGSNFNGGGIYCLGSSPTIMHCTITGNSGVEGGGIKCGDSSSPTITNCTISGNTASGNGGGFCLPNSSPAITNCTITGNSAGEGGGIFSYFSSETITNCILWNDSPGEIALSAGDGPTITYSDVQGGYEGEGNIDADPLFVDPDNGDYTLQSSSPCIDAGDPESDLDSDGTIADMGAYFYDQSSNPSNTHSLSFDGNNDYVDLGNNNLFNFNDFTVSLWFKSTWSGGGGDWIYLFGRDNHWGFWLQNAGNIRFSIEQPNGVWGNVESEGIFTDDSWHHASVTRDSETGEFALYIDGNFDQDNEDIMMGGEYSSSDLSGEIICDDNLYIGYHPVGSPGWFDGSVDEITIWNTALSASEIQSSMSTSLSGSETGLVGYWNFNEGSGTTASDATSNDNDGTINGATWSTDVPFAGTTTTSPLTWSVQAQASLGSYNDNDNYLGVASDATNTFDASYDVLEPPPSPGSSVSLYFPHEEWDYMLGDNFSTDARPEVTLTDTMQVWDFEVSSTDAGEATLTFVFTDVPEVPVILENTATGARQTLSNNSTYTFTAVADSAHPFRVSIGDTTSPSLTLGSSCSGPAILISDSTHSLGWTSTDGFEVDSVLVSFSSDSGTTYTLQAALGTVSGYDWTVPDAVVMTGGKFKVKSQDYAGNSVEKVSDYVFAIAGDSLSSAVTAGWTLWGAPIDPANDTMSANLSDDFSDYWDTFDYVDNGYTYDGILLEGEGYWLGAAQSSTIDVLGTPIASDFTMSLSQGWELISNPLVLDVSIDSLTFTKDDETKTHAEAVTAGWVNSIYGYDGAGYTAASTFSPWSGYWMAVLETDVEMTFPIHRHDGSDNSRSRDEDWMIAFDAEVEGANDEMMRIGYAETATDGFDAEHDAVNPPNPPGPVYISLFTNHPEWDYILGDQFTKDIRAEVPENGYQEWILSMESSESEAQISWTFENVPEEYDIGYSINDGVYFEDMRSVSTTTLSVSTEIIVRVGTQVLGIGDEPIPEFFALHQNYPNPFNPTTQIRYDLPEDANVNITIYDIMGRSIRSLVNSNQTAGYRSIRWDGKNNLGEGVSAGMYIYMIQAGKFSQTKKMVLLK